VGVGVLLVAGALATGAPAALAATTITVSSSAGTLGAGPAGQCTLRDALVVVDTPSNPALTSTAAPVAEPGGSGAAGDCAAEVTGAGSPYTVVLKSGQTYTLDAVDNWWFGPNGLPPISAAVTIEGNGAAITRSGAADAPAFRFFYVSGGRSGIPTGSLTLEDLTLSNGLAQGGDSGFGGGGAGMGGAVFDQGALALDRVSLKANLAHGGDATQTNGSGGGGGIGQDAPLSGSGGGFGGSAPGADGGAGGAAGTQRANGDGGGGGGFGAFDTGGFPNGGGLGGFGGNGGGSPDLTGEGGQRGDGGGGGGQSNGGGYGCAGGAFGEGGQAGIGACAGGGGGVGGGGGGATSSDGGSGGGGFGGGGAVNAGSSDVPDGGFGGGGGGERGSAGFGGGAGSTDSPAGGGGAGMGGGVFSLFGQVSVADSTLAGNDAIGGASGSGVDGDGVGGGVFNVDGSLSVRGSTIASNSASGGSPVGGGLYSLAYGNTITAGGATTASVTLAGSIVYGNTGAGGDEDDLALYDVAGKQTNASSSTLEGPNIVGETTGGGGATFAGTPITSDPELGALANNGGGSLLTMKPGAGSPAIGVGSSCDATDELGDTRPAMGCDLGAYEVTPPVPLELAAPVVSGDPKAGRTLSCSTGVWKNTPTSFAYVWSRDGTPVDGATRSTYTVQTGDEGLTLACTVTATDSTGPGAPAVSNTVHVPVPVVAHCPAATGKLGGITLGGLRLGMTRRQAQKVYQRSSDRGKRYQDFFCLTPHGIRVGYASPKLLKTLPDRQRKRLSGRVIWASTAYAYYSLQGVRPGATVAAAAKRLKLTPRFHIGLNYWYLAPNGSSTGILKVRNGTVEEIGIADKQLTRGRKAQRTFLTSFSGSVGP
jgi:hypothetical protein